MRTARFLVAMLLVGAVTGAADEDRRWENPVFESPDDAVAAAVELATGLQRESTRAEEFFVDLTLAEGDLGSAHPSTLMARTVVGDLLITHPETFMGNTIQNRTIERFTEAVPGQRKVLSARLARFGYPDLEGMTYLRLVESVDAFAGVGPASSDRMSQVGGVTYYCRYVVLPLSYVGQAAVNELHRQPGVDVAGTIRRWQNESYASLISTFRHEMVHVHTNSALDVPVYSDRVAYPTWFHEGTATYLAADPHAGLSEHYKEYQDLFFYLVQRYGVSDLQAFYARVLGGSEVSPALREVYAIEGRSDLFGRSARWHQTKDRAKTAMWVVAMIIVIAAFRGADRPTIGYLLILAGMVVGLATATGLAEHLYGLRGSAVVGAAKAGFVGATAVLVLLGVGRIRRFRRRASSA